MKIETFVLHVKSAINRHQHMEQQLSDKNLNYQYILDGDKESISETTLNNYFGGELNKLSNVTSCAYKHILAYEKMVANSIQYALIFEDDIFLKSHFTETLKKVLSEIERENLSNFLISLEDSDLRFVKRSEIKPNKLLYKKETGRLAGAYIVDIKFAEKALAEIAQNKCNMPIDWFHDMLQKKELVQIFWLSKAVATQGSLNGKIKSIIGNKHKKIHRIITYNIQRLYKICLYNFR